MKRRVEQLEDGRCRITEETGELWYSEPDRPITEGYRIYHGAQCPILTQEQVDNEKLPFFQIDHCDSYPQENDNDFSYFEYCPTAHDRSIAVRVARIKIAQKLNLLETVHYSTEEN